MKIPHAWLVIVVVKTSRPFLLWSVLVDLAYCCGLVFPDLHIVAVFIFHLSLHIVALVLPTLCLLPIVERDIFRPCVLLPPWPAIVYCTLNSTAIFSKRLQTCDFDDNSQSLDLILACEPLQTSSSVLQSNSTEPSTMSHTPHQLVGTSGV